MPPCDVGTTNRFPTGMRLAYQAASPRCADSADIDHHQRDIVGSVRLERCPWPGEYVIEEALRKLSGRQIRAGSDKIAQP